MKTALQQKQANSGGAGSNAGNIKVVCRVRPPNKTELVQFENGNQKQCLEYIEDQKTLRLNLSEAEHPSFTFDKVFPENATQQAIYEVAAKPVVQSVLEGYNGTVFAYGQTSSGKTHTMQGPSITDQEMKGIIPRMVSTLFSHVNTSPKHIEFRVKLSIVEIYLERIKDLLDTTKVNLSIREDRTRGVYIQDVTEKFVANEQEVFQIISTGNANRSVASTNMNEGSSRSHMLFIMTVHQNNLEDLSAKSGKLFLVDLAGSEKISKTGAEGKTLDEAKRINQSLSCLGNVINALTDGKSQHIPYRDSKLTRVLQESLGGNSTTTLIITCSPSSFNDQETLSTLRFGMRAKTIKNKPKINKEYTTQELLLIIQNQEKLIDEQKKQIKALEKLVGSSTAQRQDQNELEKSSISLNETANNNNNNNTTLNETIVLDTSTEELLKGDDSDKLIELEAVLESERAKCEGYAYQLNESKRELCRMESEMDGITKTNEIMSGRLNELALSLNDLEVEMMGNRLSIEQSSEVKSQVMYSITQLRRLQKDINAAKEGKTAKTQFDKNQHIVELVGQELISSVNRDLLLVCQTKLAEEEFKLFLNQTVVLPKTAVESVESGELEELKGQIIKEQEANTQFQKDLQVKDEQLREQMEKYAQIMEKQQIYEKEKQDQKQQIQNEVKQVKKEEEKNDAKAISLVHSKELVQLQLDQDKEREVWERQLAKERVSYRQGREKLLEELQEKANKIAALEEELSKQNELMRKKDIEHAAKQDNLAFEAKFYKDNIDKMTAMHESILFKAFSDSKTSNPIDNTNAQEKQKPQVVEEEEDKSPDSKKKNTKQHKKKSGTGKDKKKSQKSNNLTIEFLQQLEDVFSDSKEPMENEGYEDNDTVREEGKPSDFEDSEDSDTNSVNSSEDSYDDSIKKNINKHKGHRKQSESDQYRDSDNILELGRRNHGKMHKSIQKNNNRYHHEERLNQSMGNDCFSESNTPKHGHGHHRQHRSQRGSESLNSSLRKIARQPMQMLRKSELHQKHEQYIQEVDDDNVSEAYNIVRQPIRQLRDTINPYGLAIEMGSTYLNRPNGHNHSHKSGNIYSNSLRNSSNFGPNDQHFQTMNNQNNNQYNNHNINNNNSSSNDDDNVVYESMHHPNNSGQFQHNKNVHSLFGSSKNINSSTILQNTNTLGNSDDTDYYNILKSTETETYRSGMQNESLLLLTDPKNISKQQQQQQQLPPRVASQPALFYQARQQLQNKNPSELSNFNNSNAGNNTTNRQKNDYNDYQRTQPAGTYMSNQKNLISSFLSKAHENTTATPTHTEQGAQNNYPHHQQNSQNKKLTGSDLLRGNLALSPFVNTFSFQHLMNLQASSQQQQLQLQKQQQQSQQQQEYQYQNGTQ